MIYMLTLSTLYKNTLMKTENDKLSLIICIVTATGGYVIFRLACILYPSY